MELENIDGGPNTVVVMETKRTFLSKNCAVAVSVSKTQYPAFPLAYCSILYLSRLRCIQTKYARRSVLCLHRMGMTALT